MDFHGMKRKELQALCKKHGIPANLTNREMADRLTSIFKENEEAASLEKLSTNPEEIGSENEGKVVKKQAKKVRFSPENQTIEYEVSVYRRHGRWSRKQMLCKNTAQVIENASNSEDIKKVEDCQVRVTRSRVQNAVEEYVNMIFSPTVGRKRGRGGMKNKDAEVTNIGKPEVLEMGQREDVKNDHDKVTGGFSGRQLRSRKNVTQEDSEKIMKGKGGDEVHLLDESSEESDVREDAKSKNGPKQSTRNARKEDQSVAFSSEVEKVEVASRVTRQSRAQSKDVASMVKSEVKIVGVQGGCEEVLQLKEHQKGRGKNASRQNAVPKRMIAENSLLAVGGAEAEMPLRRSKYNAEKDFAKRPKSESQVTKVQEQSERDIALEEPPKCLRRYSSRRKSVVPESGKEGNKKEFLKKETRKRSRTTELDAIVEYSGEIERAKYAFTSQDQAPLRRSRRKTVILNAPALTDAELANKEDIGKMQQLRAPFLGKGMTEELPRKSSRNSSRYSLSGTSKEDQIAVAKNDQGVKQQMQEPILEEEKTSVLEHHSITEKPQRRSNRITAISASVAPPNPTAKGVEKKQQSKSRMAIIEEEAALTESLPAPGDLPAGKDELVVAEGVGNKNYLDLNVSKQAVKNAKAISNKRRKGLRVNSGAKKRCGFAEASPLFLDMEECKDSTGNMEETPIAKSMKLVGPSTDQEMKQSAHKSMVVCEKESNLVGDDIEKLVHGGNIESEINCMSSQSVNTTCVLDDANCSDPKRLKFESNVSHVVDSSEITFPAESQEHGMSNQKMKADIKPIETHSAHESLVVYKEDRSLVESDKERLVQVDTADSESNGSKVVCSQITSLADVFSSGNQADLAGKTSSGIELEKVFEAEEPSENMNSINYNKDDEGSGTPVAEDQIKGKLKDANVNAADSIEEGIFNDLLNELGAGIGLKRGSEIPLKKSEKLSATQFSDGEGIALTESFMKATEKQEYRAEIDVVAAITGTPIITEMKCSSSSDPATCETTFGPAPQSEDKLCSGGITVSIAGSEICNQDVETSLVEDDKEILIQDDTIDGEIKNQPCLSLNKRGALHDALVEFESNANKVVCPEMTSLAVVCSSANQTNLAGEPSNELIAEKVLDLEESPRGENVNYKSDEIEDDKNPANEDQSSMHLEDANITAAEPVQQVVFWDHFNKFCEICGTKEFEVSLKKAEETSTDDSSGKGMVQTESSVEINETSEATAKIHTVTAETGEKTFMETQWSFSGHDKTLLSPLRPEVGSQVMQGTIYRVETAVNKAGYGMSGQQKNKESVKIVENEHQETINTEKELFFSGKKILDESSEGKFWADGVFDPLSDSTDSQCAKDKVDISDRSFNNVSGETQERHICEALDGEGTDPVSSEEKDNDILENASHGDVCPQCICNEKLSFNSCPPVSNDMQEKSEAVCMDNKNTRNEIPAFFLPQLALEQLDNESLAAKQGAENGEANARAFSNATQALPSEVLTAPIISEPFAVRPHDHAPVDGERNSSDEKVMDHPFNKDFDATMDSNGNSASRETDVGQDDNIMEETAISALKVELADHSDCKVDAELYDTNMCVTKTIFQETDVSGVVTTEFLEEIPNASMGTRLPVEKTYYGDLDDQGEEVGLQRDCSSSIGLYGFKSTVGIIVDDVSKVGTLESTLNSNDPQSGTKVDDPDVYDSNAANEFDAAFTVEEAGLEDGGKTPVSHQISLHGGKQENFQSNADTPCIKPEISIVSSTLLCSSIPVSCEKELHPQVMEDINDVGGTEISIDCKVTREERDGCQAITGGFSDVTDGSLVERSKGDLEEIAEAKSDDCEGSIKRATFMDRTDSLVVNQPLCLDESKSCDVETEEPLGLHFPHIIAGDSREFGSCSKLDVVSSVKPDMVINCSFLSSICATSDEHKDLEDPDESNMEISLFFGDEDEDKKTDAKAGDSNDAALDKTITECSNSTDIKEEDYVARTDVDDTNFSVKKDGPEDSEETMELRKDVLGLEAAMADKSPLGRVVDHEEAFRSELNLLSSQKRKTVTAKKEGSNSTVSVKQLTSSTMKSKSKSSLIQRTPKQLIKHYMKENEGSTKIEQIGNRTTPKTSSKRRPLTHVWK